MHENRNPTQTPASSKRTFLQELLALATGFGLASTAQASPAGEAFQPARRPGMEVSFKLKPSANKEAYVVKNTGDMPLSDEGEGMTVGSVDSGYVPQFFDNKNKA